jgi:hypothetical protein
MGSLRLGLVSLAAATLALRNLTRTTRLDERDPDWRPR